MNRRGKKERARFDHKGGAFADGFKIGEKAAFCKIKEFLSKESRENLPFDVIQNTLDYIESQFKNDR